MTKESERLLFLSLILIPESLYFYLDSTPNNSYMKELYKYSQAAFSYAELELKNRTIGRKKMKYELLDTRVFDNNNYYDILLNMLIIHQKIF